MRDRFSRTWLITALVLTSLISCAIGILLSHLDRSSGVYEILVDAVGKDVIEVRQNLAERGAYDVTSAIGFASIDPSGMLKQVLWYELPDGTVVALMISPATSDQFGDTVNSILVGPKGRGAQKAAWADGRKIVITHGDGSQVNGGNEFAPVN